MSYFSIQELPSQVTASLDDDDAKKWMEAYNKEKPQTDEEVRLAKKKAWKACSKLPSSFSFKITASVEVPDRQGEVVDMKTLREHMDSYIDYGGNVNYNHRNYNVAHIWDWEPAQVRGHPAIKVYGNIFGGAPVFNEVRKRFINGDNFLSVAGENGPRERVCTEEGCYIKFPVTQLMEISLTGNPVNRYCELEWSHEGDTFTKSEDGLVLSVNDVEIHRTYDECPILHLKRELTKAGIEAHARENGVFIPAGFAKGMGDMRLYGLYSEPAEDGILLKGKDAMLESTFKKGLEDDQIYPDGTFKAYGAFFEKALDDRLVEYTDGEFRLVGPSEEFEKAARWKDFGEEGRAARDVMSGPRRYLRLHTSILEPGQQISSLDPNKVNLNADEVHKGQPKGVPFAGHYREDQKMPTTFIGRYSAIPQYADRQWNNLKGETFTLHPKAKYLYINDYNQLRDLFGKYHTMKPDDAKNGAWAKTSNTKPVLDYGAMAKDYDAIEWGPKMRHLSFMHQANARGEDYNPANTASKGLVNVPLSDEDLSIGRDLAKNYNLPNENIDELMIFNGNIKNDAGEDESIFYDVQPYDMSERRVKTSDES